MLKAWYSFYSLVFNTIILYGIKNLWGKTISWHVIICLCGSLTRINLCGTYQIFVFPFPSDVTPLKLNHSFVSPVDDDEDDEPLLSGSGAVQKECSEEELGSWADLLSKWKGVTPRPKQLPGLVRKVVIQLMLSFLRCHLLYCDDNNNKRVEFLKRCRRNSYWLIWRYVLSLLPKLPSLTHLKPSPIFF